MNVHIIDFNKGGSKQKNDYNEKINNQYHVQEFDNFDNKHEPLCGVTILKIIGLALIAITRIHPNQIMVGNLVVVNTHYNYI
jgi:hypothetical protein